MSTKSKKNQKKTSVKNLKKKPTKRDFIDDICDYFIMSIDDEIISRHILSVDYDNKIQVLDVIFNNVQIRKVLRNVIEVYLEKQSKDADFLLFQKSK